MQVLDTLQMCELVEQGFAVNEQHVCSLNTNVRETEVVKMKKQVWAVSVEIFTEMDTLNAVGDV